MSVDSVERSLKLTEVSIEPFMLGIINRVRTDKSAEQRDFTGSSAFRIFRMYSNLLHWHASPIQGGRIVELGPDPSGYIEGEYFYCAPPLGGPVRGTDSRVDTYLKSAEVYHPLAFHRDPAAHDRRDWIMLRLAQGPVTEGVAYGPRTTFHFYPDHFERSDSGLGSTFGQVMRGDFADLVGTARFLGRCYRELAKES